VIIWLNGPFGIGKTTAAQALVQRLPDGLLYDPELIGELLRQMVGAIDPVSDFQDLLAWRELVVDTARVLCQTYRRTLVMPMTVWRQAYFDELLEGLRRADPDIRCFRLMASEAVLRARILGWPTTEGAHDWCLAHLPSGLHLMQDSRFGHAVPTDDRTPGDVAAAIIAETGQRPAD
jgi:hypothetical protein